MTDAATRGCNGRQAWLAGTASAAGLAWTTAQGRASQAMIARTPGLMAAGVAPVLGWPPRSKGSAKRRQPMTRAS
jgi:hypothetical protein